MSRCRDCALYDLEAVKNARGAVMKDRLGACKWKYKGTPASITISHLPQPRFMTPNCEHKCQTFVPRKEAK